MDQERTSGMAASELSCQHCNDLAQTSLSPIMNGMDIVGKATIMCEDAYEYTGSLAQTYLIVL